MAVLLIYLLYTVTILVASYKFKIVRYKLLFGYFLGTTLGIMMAFYFDLKIAIAISIFVGLVAIVKMSIH